MASPYPANGYSHWEPSYPPPQRPVHGPTANQGHGSSHLHEHSTQSSGFPMDPRSQFQFIAGLEDSMLTMSGNAVYLALKEEVTGLRLEKHLFSREMELKDIHTTSAQIQHLKEQIEAYKNSPSTSASSSPLLAISAALPAIGTLHSSRADIYSILPRLHVPVEKPEDYPLVTNWSGESDDFTERNKKRKRDNKSPLTGYHRIVGTDNNPISDKRAKTINSRLRAALSKILPHHRPKCWSDMPSEVQEAIYHHLKAGILELRLCDKEDNSKAQAFVTRKYPDYIRSSMRRKALQQLGLTATPYGQEGEELDASDEEDNKSDNNDDDAGPRVRKKVKVLGNTVKATSSGKASSKRAPVRSATTPPPDSRSSSFYAFTPPPSRGTSSVVASRSTTPATGLHSRASSPVPINTPNTRPIPQSPRATNSSRSSTRPPTSSASSTSGPSAHFTFAGLNADGRLISFPEKDSLSPPPPDHPETAGTSGSVAHSAQQQQSPASASPPAIDPTPTQAPPANQNAEPGTSSVSGSTTPPGAPPTEKSRKLTIRLGKKKGNPLDNLEIPETVTEKALTSDLGASMEPVEKNPEAPTNGVEDPVEAPIEAPEPATSSLEEASTPMKVLDGNGPKAWFSRLHKEKYPKATQKGFDAAWALRETDPEHKALHKLAKKKSSAANNAKAKAPKGKKGAKAPA